MQITPRTAMGIVAGAGALALATGATLYVAARDDDDPPAPAPPVTPPTGGSSPVPSPAASPTPGATMPPPVVAPPPTATPSAVPTTPAPAPPAGSTPPPAPRPPVATPTSSAPARPVQPAPTPPADPYLAPRPLAPGATRLGSLGWLRIQPGPAGMTVADGRIVHTVARGDTMAAIARSYSRHYHLDISTGDVQRANPGVEPTRIQPGQQLGLPPVITALVEHRLKRNPGLVDVQGDLRHQIGRGETLSGIARHYRDEFGVGMTHQQIQAANADVIRDPNRISTSMPPLVLPGIGYAAAPSPVAPPTISQLDGVEVATRRAIVRDESGRTSDIPVMHYRVNGSHAEFVGASYEDAMRAATKSARRGNQGGHIAAVVQARDGYWMTPLRAEEDAGLDDSTTTERLYVAQANPWLRGGLAEIAPGDSEVTTDHWPDPRDY